MLYILDVYVMNSSLNINRPFTYYSTYEIDLFKRVSIEFNHAKAIGLVTNVEAKDIEISDLESLFDFKVGEIIEVIDDKPILSKELYDLAYWLSKVTISPLISCLNAMLPKELKISKSKRKAKKEIAIKKIDKDLSILTKRQIEVYDALKDGMKLSSARKLSLTIVNKLVELGYLEKYERDAISNEIEHAKDEFKELTDDQKEVYNGIINSKKRINLLFGVTGSGKTEVYLHLARHYLKQNKQVLILVPEISLTPQMIERVRSRFNDVAIYHSYLSDMKRYEEYNKVLNNEVNIVIGTRSAVFLPFSNLGLIIVDEEHDQSYKQDNVPCYNAKQVVFKRANDVNAKVVLASATPSLDTYSRALKGSYGKFNLKKRINNTIPIVEVIDLKKELKDGGSYILSEDLKKEIETVLSHNKQAIILLNRRGYAPIVRCADCGSVMMCDDCETALTYHKDSNLLKCNMCGKTYKMVQNCPSCGSSNIVAIGLGTKKVVENLNKLFPSAKIGRMDSDNTRIKDGHEKILRAFSNHQYDILVGTQMIAKGLDYPDVVLVGILNADSGLLKMSFNSTETTFDLLMQASGRSGRANDEGKVIIQAFNSDHYVLKAVEKQDYDYFYNIEMNYRYKADYPPYTNIVTIVLTDDNLKRLERSLSYLDDLTKDLKERRFKPFKLNKIKRKERYRFTFFSNDLRSLLNILNAIVDDYINQKNMSSIKVDVNPLYLE